jgi:hypothetical protein
MNKRVTQLENQIILGIKSLPIMGSDPLRMIKEILEPFITEWVPTFLESQGIIDNLIYTSATLWSCQEGVQGGWIKENIPTYIRAQDESEANKIAFIYVTFIEKIKSLEIGFNDLAFHLLDEIPRILRIIKSPNNRNKEVIINKKDNDLEILVPDIIQDIVSIKSNNDSIKLTEKVENDERGYRIHSQKVKENIDSIIKNLERISDELSKLLINSESFNILGENILPKDINKKFLEFLIWYFLIPNWKFAYFLPSKCYERMNPLGNKVKQFGRGGIIITTSKEINEEILLRLLGIIQVIYNRIAIIDEIALSQSHALWSAVAAIMSRNMSHNIGSHVLAYYEQSLKEINREAQPLDEAREKFNRYLQARMDYIAYVTTITPSYGVGFTLEEIINEFNENKILIKGLAASENFKEVQINLINDNSTYKDLLSFSMGELGKHALFNIFEGIARNTAKHGYPEGPPNGIDKLSIYVKPIDKGDFVQLEIWDDAKSYEKAKIALNLDGDKEKDARYHKFIGDTGILQSEFWGIKEMRVGSLFLKRIPLTKIQDDEILAIDFKNKEGSLCYVLNMYKFKYLLIVSNKVNGFQRGRYIDMVNTEKLNELGKTEYKLCVIDKETTISPKEEMNLPLRRIYDNIDDKKLVLSNNEENEKKLVLGYYDKWLKERCRLNSTEIIYSPLDDKVIKEIENKWGKNITVKKIDPCTEDLKGKIIFAGHLIKSSINCKGKDESYVKACLSKVPLFIQDVSGKTQYLKTTLNNPPDDDFKKWIFVYEIKEAACEPVIIFDERLWKRYKEEKDYPEYLQKGQNIIFANLKSDNRGKKEIEFKDLEGQTVLTIKKQDSNGLSFEWKNSKKYTFACFHLGIIEKISEIFDVGVSTVIENLSRNKKNTFEHLIIHTGRGKTLKYDEPLLYMDLTSLQRGVEEGKIYLIQTLYSLKPTRGV